MNILPGQKIKDRAMQLPRKALRDGQLRHTSAGQAVEASGHKVSKAEFTDSDGAIITGFFKPVGPDYTELSAKYSTAVSIAMRFALGDKVAEDRLVFNKQGQIVGTFSIAVDDYKPLLSFKGKVPSDQQEKELVCPSVRTLLKHDVASLLVSSWRYKDDDRHPGNFSLKYAIDPDMSLYNRTSKIKGGRLVDVIRNKDIEEATALQFAHITNFPNVPGRTHWPTYKLPDNYNFLKQNASYYEFQQLATNPALETDEGSTSFQEQMFNAMLKELLAFEPDMWMLAFDDYFGDTPLDYLSLDPYKSEQLSKYQPLLYNTVTDRESFAKHALAVFQQEYDELCRTVVFYPGCEKNEYGVSVVSFNHFLRNKPSSLKKTLDWAESQNKLMATHWDRYQLYLINPEIKLYLRDRGRPEISFTKLSEANLFIANEGEAWTSYQLSLLNPKIKLYLLEMGRQDISFTSLSEANLFIANEGNAWTNYQLKVKERKRQEANEKEVETFDNIIDSPPLNGYIVPENGRYQLDKMRQRYHKIWRDSQLGCLKTIIEQTKALEKRLVKELSLQTLDKLDTTTTSEPAVDMSNITEAHQLIKACSSFESAMQIDCDPQNSLGLGLKLLDAFRVELIEICDKYYELPHVELHYDNNEKFCDDLRKLVKDNETKICNALHPTPEEKLFSRIAESIEQYACSLYFQRHLRRADKPLGTEEQHNYPALLRREHTEKELITSCLKALFDWAAAIDREVLIFYIEDVIRHYQQSSWGKRGEEVSVYLKNSPEDGANLLARILSIGGCESNSLNTHLISKLIPLMLKDTIGQVEVNLLIVQQAFEQNEFKAIIYAKEAQQYATTDPRFEHVCASKSMQIFNDTLYNWVATQTPEKFHELVKSAVGKYNPYSLNF